MKNSLLHTVLLLLFVAIVTSRAMGQQRESAYAAVDVIAPELLSPEGQNIARVKVANTSLLPLGVRIMSINTPLQYSNPAGSQLFTLGAGEEKFFPIYLKIPGGNIDSLHGITVEIQISWQDSTWQESITRQLPVERMTRIICRVPDQDMLLSKEKQDADLRLSISNQGNTFKNLVIELVDPQHPSAYPLVEVLMAPGRDTLLSWNNITDFEQALRSEKQYYLTVKDPENSSQVYFYQLIRVQSLQSSRQYLKPHDTAPNTLGFRYEQWDDVHYYSMTGNGNMPVSRSNGYSLLYQFYLRKYPFSEGISADQLRLEFSNGKNTLQVGDIYYGQETGLYNRGIEAEVKVGENLFINGSYTHSDLLPSAFYQFRKEEITTAGIRIQGDSQSTSFKYIYQNDQLLSTHTHLLLAGNERKIGDQGRIESGIGLSAETFENKPVYDAAAFINLDYHTPEWDFSSDNRYSGSAYPFINRGDTHFRQLFSYKPSSRLSYNAELLVQRFSPQYRYLPSSSTTAYRNNRGSLGISLYHPLLKYGLSVGAGTNRLFAPYLNSSETYRNNEFFIKGDIHLLLPEFSLQLRQELSRIIPRVTNKSAYYAGVTELNAVFYDTYLSLYLNKGAYTFFDQANYVLNGFSRDFFIARILRSFSISQKFSVKLSADHYRDYIFDYRANTIAVAPEFRYRSYEISYEAGYRAINGSGFFLQNLNLYKNFGNPLQPKHTLRLQAFNDLNFNGTQESLEPPVKNVMLDIGSVRLLTDQNGKAVLKNLPRQKYTVKLLDKQDLSSNKNIYEVFLRSSQTLFIPLHKGVSLQGRINVKNGNEPITKSSLRILVTDTQTGEQLLIPCDYTGKFKVVLQKGKTYQFSVDPSVIPETYRAVTGQQTIDTRSERQQEVLFILENKERKVIRKQFGSR